MYPPETITAIEPVPDIVFVDHVPDLIDNELVVDLVDRVPPDHRKGLSPYYKFQMRHIESNEIMGGINFRIGKTHNDRYYRGNIGFTVFENYRGNRYAARSCRLIAFLGKHHGIDPIWLTCNIDNTASIKTMELIGANYVDTTEMPDDYPYLEYYPPHARKKMRFRLTVVGTGIDRMMSGMLAAGLPKPRFKYNDFFVATLRRPKKDAGSIRNGSLKSSLKTTDKIIEIIGKNPQATADMMASDLSISVRAVKKQLATLKQSGRVRRVGPDKGGRWEIVGK